jgi:hypothetical protein
VALAAWLRRRRGQGATAELAALAQRLAAIAEAQAAEAADIPQARRSRLGRAWGWFLRNFLMASLPLTHVFHRSSDSHGAQSERESLAGEQWCRKMSKSGVLPFCAFCHFVFVRRVVPSAF